MVVEVLPYSGSFITCMVAHFPAVELEFTIRFSTLSRMSKFLWHSFKWACWLSHFLHYASGLEMLACSLDIDLSYVTAMLQLPTFLEQLSEVATTLLSEVLDVFL